MSDKEPQGYGSTSVSNSGGDEGGRSARTSASGQSSTRDPDVVIAELRAEVGKLQATLIDRDSEIHSLHRFADLVQEDEDRKLLLKRGLSVIERSHVETTSTGAVLHDSMHHLCYTMVDTFGGCAGVLLLDVPHNAPLGAHNTDLKSHLLLRAYWSERPCIPLEVLQALQVPKMFRDVLTQKKGKVLSAWELGVAKEQAHGLCGVHSVMAVPVVVDAASIALVLLLNGEYTSRDPKVLTGVLSELWTSNVQPLINLALDTERQKETEAKLVMESLQRDEIILCLDQMLEDVVQEKLQWTAGRMSSEQLWRRILQRVADFFGEYFGADVLVAVTNTDANFRMHKNTGSAGSVSGRDSQTERVAVRDLSFIYYVFSRNMEQVRAMKMKHLDHPKLAESTLMADAIESGEPYHTSDTKHLNLPCGHMKMNNVLLVPILFCEEPVGMLGLANGEFTVSSGRILQSVFKTFWSMFVKATVMSESQEVLNAALPLEISERVKGGKSIADSYETASVMFADIVGFTSFTKDLEPIEVVEFSNLIFAKLDKLVQDFGLEKIKVIGDCYMVAGGLKYKGGKKVLVTDRCCQAQLDDMVAFALRILDEAKSINESGAALGSGRVAEKLQKHPLQFRIGIAEGPITAGVFGTAKVQYDVLGATVNLASRLESNGRPGAIHVNQSIFNHLQDDAYVYEKRPPITLKGLGLQQTYFIGSSSAAKKVEAPVHIQPRNTVFTYSPLSNHMLHNLTVDTPGARSDLSSRSALES